ncbi:MAG TPA: ribosome maturation factor RimM [Candidatus Dormibacteraeota bacterium]|nr:ribosome maturation factor RimM [Candidatus Dormibacteraeota bacterium]
MAARGPSPHHDVAGDAAPARLRAALVRRPHGVAGELRVEPLGGDAGRFGPSLRLWSEPGDRPLTVSSARPASEGHVLLRLEEVRGREAAEALRGAYLCVDTADRRCLRDGEWFVWELVGLRVATPGGVELGRVADVEDYRDHQVLVVRDAGGAQARYPMSGAFVEAVDLEAGTMTVAPWPEEA